MPSPRPVRRGTPNTRRTAANSSAIAAVPPSASGSFSAVELNLSSSTLATCSHRSIGGLSIATVRRLHRAEEEVVQRQRHAPHGAVVERVGVDRPEVDEPNHAGADRDQQGERPAAQENASQPVDRSGGGNVARCRRERGWRGGRGGHWLARPARTNGSERARSAGLSPAGGPAAPPASSRAANLGR